MALATAALSCNDPPTDPSKRSLHLRWSQAQPGATNSRPAILGDVVYFGTGDGRVMARERRTGAARWSAPIAPGGAVEAANIIARKGVVVAAGVQHAVGLDAASGRELWRYSPPLDTVGTNGNSYPGQLVASRLAADDAAAYLPAWGASVSAVDLHTGAVRWVWEPGVSAGDTATSGRFASGSMGAAVSGDTVFVTVWHALDRQGLKSDEWLVALDRASGRELWRVVMPSYTGGLSVEGAPGFFGNLAIFGTVGGRVWAVDRSTQQIVWQFIPPARYYSPTEVEVADDAVFVNGSDDFLYSLDAASGSVRWKSNAGSGATRDLLVTATRIYYPTAGSLLVFDRASGRQLATARVSPEGDIWETPATAASGEVYITSTKAAQSFDEP